MRGGGAGAALVALCGVAFAARAQEPAPTSPPSLSVELVRDSAGVLRTPRVRAIAVLDDGVFDAPLRNGFPIQLHFRLDLYRDATLFDRLERSASWDAVVRLDPLDQRFDLVRTGGTVERLEDVTALRRALSVPFDVDVLPAGRGRFYYAASLEIESLSLTELEEVERWLRGELEPAVRRGRDLGDALGRGARRLLIRFSGLPRRRLEARSEAFTN